MQYNIDLQELAKDLNEAFITFLHNYNIDITVEEAHYLLDYAISTMYSLECEWYTDSIRMYGVVCINAITSVMGIDESLSYEDRVALVKLACSYFVAEVGVNL